MKAYIDIGSTVLKVALLDGAGLVAVQSFIDRSYEDGIAAQVDQVLGKLRSKFAIESVRICSSANGGIRVGILGLTRTYSAAIAGHLALSAGANVVVSHVIDEANAGPTVDLDVLIVTGGIDCPETPRLEERVRSLDLSGYRFKSLVYAGNRHLFESFGRHYPDARVVGNPMGADLSLSSEALLEVLRLAYIDDLVDRQGIRELHEVSEVPIWPTPGVVNLAFGVVSACGSDAAYPSPFVVMDIGGATTDVHFGLECLAERSALWSTTFRGANRHVFTDLGVFASKASTEVRMRSHERFFDLLEVIYGEDASRKYAEFAECEMDKPFLFAACLFLALDALTSSGGDKIPNLELSKLGAVIITGGASQSADIAWLQAVMDMFLADGAKGRVKVLLDDNYQLWVQGLAQVPPLK